MDKQIDEMIKRKFREDNYIPSSTMDAIDDILKQHRNIVVNVKPNKHSIMKKLVAAMASIIVIFIGSVSVYAALGGTISGKPILEWFGIEFPDKYEEYKVDIEGQEVVYNETKIDLVSTICDDGLAIFEFDVKLSKEDKEYLRLGEKVVSEEELKAAEEKALKEQEEHEKNNTVGFGNYSATGYYRILSEGKEFINTINMIVNDDLLGPDHAKYNILIDNEGYYANDDQTVTKISDYEYKIFQLYFLTDEILKGKTDFSVTIKLNALENIADTYEFRKTQENKMHLANIESNERRIDLTGEFNVNLSKNKALENTKVINPDSGKAAYKYMTKEIEEVKVTPLQIIVKVKTHIDNVSLQSLASTGNKNYIGATSFDIYDNLGNELVSRWHETKRTITYANGKVEEWAPGDIGTYKSFYNAQMDLIEYIIIEKKDNIDSIKIVPTVKELVFKYDGTDQKLIELDAINVNLNSD